jgi:hypothetical protein
MSRMPFYAPAHVQFVMEARAKRTARKATGSMPGRRSQYLHVARMGNRWVAPTVRDDPYDDHGTSINPEDSRVDLGFSPDGWGWSAGR